MSKLSISLGLVSVAVLASVFLYSVDDSASVASTSQNQEAESGVPATISRPVVQQSIARTSVSQARLISGQGAVQTFDGSDTPDEVLQQQQESWLEPERLSEHEAAMPVQVQTTSSTPEAGTIDQPALPYRTEKVIAISIQGNQVTQTESSPVNGISSSQTYRVDTGSSQQTPTESQQSMDTSNSPQTETANIDSNQQQQEAQQLECPKSLYMGGNAYARSMLIRRGCPIP